MTQWATKKKSKTINYIQLGQIADVYLNLQNYNPVIGEADTANEGHPSGIVGPINNNYFAYFEYNFFSSKTRLVRYDSLLRKSASVFVFEDKEDDSLQNAFEKIVVFGNRLCMFTSQYNKTENEGYSKNLYIETVNNSNLKVENRKLLTSDPVQIKTKTVYFFEVSPDTSQLAIVNFIETEKKDISRGTVKVFDKQLNILWQSSLELPYNFSDFDTDVKDVELRMKLERDGSFNILTPDGHLYRYVERSKEKIITINGTDNQTFKDIQFYSFDKQVVFTGLSALRTNTDTTRGRFFYSYNLLTDSFDIKKLETDSVLDDVFFVDNIITTKDAGSILIVKKTIKEKYPVKGSASYLYQDVVVLKRDANGKVEWETKVPSSALRDNNTLLSLYRNGTLYIAFNAKGNMYITTISNTGKVIESKPIWYDKVYEAQLHRSNNNEGKMLLYINKVSVSPVKIYALVKIL